MECYFSEPDESLRIVNGGAAGAEKEDEGGSTPSFLTVASLIEESVFWSQLLRDDACISIDMLVN